MFLDINNTTDIIKRLNKLENKTNALFGKMSAQHMIEHLALAFTFSNGKNPVTLQYNSEKGQKIKTAVIFNDDEMPIGYKSPMLPKEELLPLKHPDLPTAKKQLIQELLDFFKYFELNPDAKPENPVAGILTFKEWVIFHNKHITHHFRQFGLL